MNFRSNLAYFSTVPAQVIMAVLSAVAVMYLLHKPITNFHAVGQESFVKKVTPDVIGTWGKEPVHVKTGFLLHEFIKFDVTKNDFLINAILWFEFDPRKVSLDTLSKFSFTKGTILSQSEPMVKKISDSLSFVQYHLRIEFSSVLDYALFPIDDHKIFLNLTNNTIEADALIFDVAPENYVVPLYVFLSGWKIVKHGADSGFAEYSLSEDKKVVQNPKVLFSISIKKTDMRQLVMILLPLFILFYFFVFSLMNASAQSIAKVDLNISLMLTILMSFMAYTIVIQGLSPAVGYFMLIDYLTLYFLTVFFFIGLISFVEAASVGDRYEEVFEQMKSIVAIAIYVSLIAVIYYLTRVYKG